jgi:hypothetical protein
MSRIARLGTMAGRLAATAYDAGDATGTEVLKSGHFSDQAGTLYFEISDGFGHWSPFLF